jgi:hypothetical protein
MKEDVMTSLSRRAFALSLPAASAFAASTFPARAVPSAAKPLALVPSAQISIGRFTITAVSDGYADMPFSYFPGRTPEQVEAAARPCPPRSQAASGSFSTSTSSMTASAGF